MENRQELQPTPATPPAVLTSGIIEAPKPLTVGEHVFQPIVLGERTVAGKRSSRIYHFSQREIRFLDKYLETRSLPAACVEVGIDEVQGAKWTKKKKFRDYFAEKTRIAALSNGTTIQEHIAFLRETRDGLRNPTERAMDAAKQLTRFLKPTGPASVNVNVNQSVQVQGASSPFKGATIEELTGAMKQRIEIIEATVVKE